MNSQSPVELSQSELVQLVKELQAEIVGLSEESVRLSEENARLSKENAKLQELLTTNSQNSGKPPSTDTPKQREQRRRSKRRLKPSEKRKRGAQKGHAGHHRQLVEAEKVDHIVDCYPEGCACGAELASDSTVERHQVVEIPPIVPIVTEYRIHSQECPCGRVHHGQLPEGVTMSPFGPRLVALICLLTGLYRLSKRRSAHLLASILGVTISIGAICRCERRMSSALAQSVSDLTEYARAQAVKHTDATSWRESGIRRQLWTIATTLATVFIITLDGTKNTVRRLLGNPVGILVSDRARVFSFWPMRNRQVCWAHLIRMFVKFTERSGESHRIGEELLCRTKMLFDLWYRVRDGTLKRSSFQQYVCGIRMAMKKLLDDGETCKHKKTEGSCKELKKLFDAMWTFVRVEGVEPTNNNAERELRHLVIWRQTSFGTQSESGSQYIVRLASVVSTLRKQDRDVLEYLTDAYLASLLGKPAPALLPVRTP